MMNNVVIVSACRTPIGTMGGQFKSLQPIDLTIPVMKELVKRAKINPAIIEDIIWGCNYQRTYLENNLARVAAVKAGMPENIPGITIHRNCTSSLSSVQLAYYQIKSGEAGCIMAGGTESMSSAPHMVFGARYGNKFGHMELRDSMWDSLMNPGVGPAMGITAENVAKKYGITRRMQDQLAMESQNKAIKAMDDGKFKEEIVSVKIKNKEGHSIVDADEYPKREVTIKALGDLKAAFKENGTVTAGNSSGMNDASSGLILMEEEKAKTIEVPLLARVISTNTIGLSPDIMGMGPVYATQNALKKIGMAINDLGLIELNEAFAAQACACIKELGLDKSIVNVNGSGISLGHPVAATGARMITTLLYEMKRRNVKYGLATACAGGGMGVAIILENIIRPGLSD